MSEISDLAKNFSNQSKQQVSDLNASVASDMKKLKGNLKKELNAAEQTLKKDIAALEERLKSLLHGIHRKMALLVWTPVLVVVVLIGISFPLLKYQGQQLMEVHQQINQAKVIRQELNLITGNCNGVRCIQIQPNLFSSKQGQTFAIPIKQEE